MDKMKWIKVEGARVHNLKNIDVEIPRNALVVFTGLSGSGKSSLAFDTIYAEGQRRYIDSFSAYARQFLGGVERPDVDRITGLSPVISIEQKSTNKNPRSTVGTVTEIADFLRLMYARIGTAYSYVSGLEMVKYSESQIVESIIHGASSRKVHILSPLVKGRKGHYRELFERMAKNGFYKVRVDGSFMEIKVGLKLDRYKVHDIEILIDSIDINKASEKRLLRAVSLALKWGKGSLVTIIEGENTPRFYSRHLMCPVSGVAYDEPAPNLFSFNSPYGACSVCNGLGRIPKIDPDKIFPDRSLSIKNGGIAPLGAFKSGWIFNQLTTLLSLYNLDLTTPISEFTEELIQQILYGMSAPVNLKNKQTGGMSSFTFPGISEFIESQLEDESSIRLQKWAKKYMQEMICSGCNGSRLNPQALSFKIDGITIHEMSELSLSELHNRLSGLGERLPTSSQVVGNEILKEVSSRLGFLLEVGLGYLSLSRPTRSLSGGEAQRIRLATQIGSQLVGVLYILDEPSIGLHPRDNDKLIAALCKLRDAGNSVLVVEHDKEMMLAADHIIEIGPGAGSEGGRVLASASPDEFLALNNLTSEYLRGVKNIPIPAERRKGNGLFLSLSGATGNNLKSVEFKIPLNTLVCVSGVSGSGKSTLINETLYPVLSNLKMGSELTSLPFKQIKGDENLDKVIRIDQSPIGRTPRSNAATYTGVFTDIRELFAVTPDAKIRGYKLGRFSFNVKGGRCETCGGAGVKIIEMNFLPDVEIRCESCNGARYNRETLAVKYKGLSIAEVLDLQIRDAVQFFSNIPSIYRKISVLNEIGLGYLTLFL
jgi:excinuclease ABC subunit A